MLTFFRRIRKKLLSENRVTRYLLYALGEILLVVIGILIALQVNNWNQARARTAKEIEILKSFKLQFERDIKEFDSSLAFYRGAKASIRIVLEQLEGDRPYHDSLALHFFRSTRYWGTSDMDNNVYETLKSIGVDLVSNKELRGRIVELYDDNDEWIANFERDYVAFMYHARDYIYPTRFRDFWNGDYQDRTYTGQMVPLDFEALKTDQPYLYYLRTQKYEIGWLLEKPLENTKAKIISIIADLEEEIGRLEGGA